MGAAAQSSKNCPHRKLSQRGKWYAGLIGYSDTNWAGKQVIASQIQVTYLFRFMEATIDFPCLEIWVRGISGIYMMVHLTLRWFLANIKKTQSHLNLLDNNKFNDRSNLIDRNYRFVVSLKRKPVNKFNELLRYNYRERVSKFEYCWQITIVHSIHPKIQTFFAHNI